MQNNFFEMLGVEDSVPSSSILGKPSGNTGGDLFQMVWDSYTPRTFQQPVQKQPEQSKTDYSFDKLFAKVVQQESRGKHRNAKGELTTSPVGAKGITQVMPKTGVDPGYGVAPLKDDSEQEYLRFGKDLLKAYTKELGGDIRKGLAAYNAGPGKVKTLLTKHGEQGWESKLPKETRDYLKKILGT